MASTRWTPRLPSDGPSALEYEVGVQSLAHLGVTRMRLITNNPQKGLVLEGHGLALPT